MLHALRCDDPVMFLEHRELLTMKGPVPAEDYEIEFGQRERRARGHDDHGRRARADGAANACRCATSWRATGISVELIDPRTVSPLDTETILQSVARTGRLLIVDEAPAPRLRGRDRRARRR